MEFIIQCMEGGFQNPTEFVIFILPLKKKLSTWVTVHICTVFSHLWGTQYFYGYIFSQNGAFEGPSMYPSISYVSGTAITHMSNTARTKLYTSVFRHSDPLRSVLCIQKEWDSTPGQNADLAIATQPNSQCKAPFYFCRRQGQALHFHL